jgi:DNA-binding response OmpR family regulator
VLVIDDEKAIGKTVSRMLEMAGLAALVAGDGPGGLDVFREQQHRINAVVLDLTMPRMSGLEVAQALRGLSPDLPIVLMSGFSVLEVTLQSAGLGITAFVQKPFKMAELLGAVRYALGQ